jgi:hypothetical protein
MADAQGMRLPSGSVVHHARTRLYYVDQNDELVQIEIAGARAPQSASDVISRNVLAHGIENMQIDCQFEAGGGLTACAGPLSTGDALFDEATAAFGDFGTAGGPRITVPDDPLAPAAAARVSALRTVTISVALRSRDPLAGPSNGDPKVQLDGKILPVGGGTDGGQYVRRAYQLTLAIRNTSLGSM